MLLGYLPTKTCDYPDVRLLLSRYNTTCPTWGTFYPTIHITNVPDKPVRRLPLENEMVLGVARLLPENDMVLGVIGVPTHQNLRLSRCTFITIKHNTARPRTTSLRRELPAETTFRLGRCITKPYSRSEAPTLRPTWAQDNPRFSLRPMRPNNIDRNDITTGATRRDDISTWSMHNQAVFTIRGSDTPTDMGVRQPTNLNHDHRNRNRWPKRLY